MNNTGRESYQLTHLDRNDLISELYNRYGRKLYAYAIRTWHINEDESWDLVYRTLYKVIDSYSKYSFTNEEKFGSFVFRIFINYLRNHYRDHKKEFENFKIAEVDAETIQNQPEAMLPEESANVKLRLLNAELDKMEDWQRILLLMRSDGRPYSEIARYVDKPEEQLKVYYQRLKKLLTDKINGQV